MNKNIRLLILAILCVVLFSVVVFALFVSSSSSAHTLMAVEGTNVTVVASAGTCGKSSSCTAKDDVNNPAYNMQNVITQTILLEEHLAEDNKYCEPCIVKHFLHIVGLLQEAIWMACKKYNDYPKMLDSLELYESSFKEWLKVKGDKEKRLNVLSVLRKHRQELIEVYYLSKDEEKKK